VLEVEIVGSERLGGRVSEREIRRLCEASARRLGIDGGHVAVEIVDAARIEQLNVRHRGLREPTDVLSFPIDGLERLDGEQLTRELGDIVICPRYTADLREAVVHGMLHLLGMDHERDNGEMLALQDELVAVPPR
jgi:probable rRNA maturation factor